MFYFFDHPILDFSKLLVTVAHVFDNFSFFDVSSIFTILYVYTFPLLRIHGCRDISFGRQLLELVSRIQLHIQYL